MRALLVATVVMGVLIVAGVAVIGTALFTRVAVPAAGPDAVLLEEPAGTRINGVALAPDRMAVQLSGAGPDRVVVVDTRTGRVVNRTALAH